MESLGSRSIRRRDRVREKHRKNSIKKYAQSLCVLCTYVCSMNTFYTSPRRTDRSTTVLQCSLRSIYAVVPFGSGSLCESGGNHRGFGLGVGEYKLKLDMNSRKRSMISIS